MPHININLATISRFSRGWFSATVLGCIMVAMLWSGLIWKHIENRAADLADFTHVGKLDADVELPPDYFERLLASFAEEPRLGVLGGTLLEEGIGGWRPTKVPAYHVRGALKLYSRECFEAIGGIEERLGWDTIDETYARMRGWRTGNLLDLVAVHHRPEGSADGTLRGRARHGTCAYIAHFGPVWVGLRAVKVARSRPVGLSGLAFLWGYARAEALRVDRVPDPAFRRYARWELRRRMRRAVTGALLPRRVA